MPEKQLWKPLRDDYSETSGGKWMVTEKRFMFRLALTQVDSLELIQEVRVSLIRRAVYQTQTKPPWGSAINRYFQILSKQSLFKGKIRRVLTNI